MTYNDITFQINDDECKLYAIYNGITIGNMFFIKINTDKLMISETEIETQYKNQNIELYMVQEIIKMARQTNRKIISISPHISEIFIKHPEFDDIRMLNYRR